MDPCEWVPTIRGRVFFQPCRIVQRFFQPCHKFRRRMGVKMSFFIANVRVEVLDDIITSPERSACFLEVQKQPHLEAWNGYDPDNRNRLSLATGELFYLPQCPVKTLMIIAIEHTKNLVVSSILVVLVLGMLDDTNGSGFCRCPGNNDRGRG